MRLIDADARVTVQSFDVEHEEYDHTEMSVEEALEFVTDEGCPPFIDAVPRVMTLKEVLIADKPFFIEKPSNEDGDKEWSGWGVVDTEDREAGTIMFAVIGKSQRLLCDVETMGEYFRCWTAKPTYEQRKAVK